MDPTPDAGSAAQQRFAARPEKQLSEFQRD
jgi:hypothetical protein